MKKFAAAAAAVALTLLAVPAQSNSGVKVGMLSCDIGGGVGYILGSSKTVDCTYQPASHRKAEHYQGSLGRYGVDLGYTAGAKLVWAVFAPGKVNAGALEGSYGGAGVEATAVVGPGANVLVGGFKKTITLQPVSLQGQAGLNVAAGLASLRLDYVGR
jgi:hypothetical protein